MVRIAASEAVIEGWLNDSVMPEFANIGTEISNIATQVNTIEYSGPNATAVSVAAGTSLTGLVEGTEEQMKGLVIAVENAVNAVLGAGGVEITDVTPPAIAAEANIAGPIEDSQDVVVDTDQIEAAAAVIETAMNAMQTSCGNIIDSIAGHPLATWEGASRTAAENAVTDHIGEAAVNLNVDRSAQIVAGGGSITSANELDPPYESMRQAIAYFSVSIGDALFAMSNEIQTADESISFASS